MKNQIRKEVQNFLCRTYGHEWDSFRSYEELLLYKEVKSKLCGCITPACYMKDFF